MALSLHWTCGSQFYIGRNPNPNPNLDHELSGGSHSHTTVGQLSFPYSVSLSFPFVVSLSFPYSGRATLISICRVAIILIQRSGYSHFHLSCRCHSHTAVGLLSFPFVVSLSFSYSGRATLILYYHVWLSLSLSRVAGRIPRAVQGRDVGHLSPRST